MHHDFIGRDGGEVCVGFPNDSDGDYPEPVTGWDYCWTMNADRASWIDYANDKGSDTLPEGDRDPSVARDLPRAPCPRTPSGPFSPTDLKLSVNPLSTSLAAIMSLVAVVSACTLPLGSDVISLDDTELTTDARLRFIKYSTTPIEGSQPRLLLDLEPQEIEANRWNEALRTATDGTWMRIQAGGTGCGRNPGRRAPLDVLESPEEVRAFVETLDIDAAGVGQLCMCCGSLSLDFFRGDQRVVSLSVHHGQRLRWSNGPGLNPELQYLDGIGARLTETSITALRQRLSHLPGGSDGGISFVSLLGPDVELTLRAPSATLFLIRGGVTFAYASRTLPDECRAIPLEIRKLSSCLDAIRGPLVQPARFVIVARPGTRYDHLVHVLNAMENDDVRLGFEWP